jgi:hypothetical protein
VTDEQITATNQAERLRVMIAALSDSGQGCFSKESLRAILTHIDAQAAEIARLSYALGCIANEDWDDMTAELARDTARAALTQETQP